MQIGVLRPTFFIMYFIENYHRQKQIIELLLKLLRVKFCFYMNGYTRKDGSNLFHFNSFPWKENCTRKIKTQATYNYKRVTVSTEFLIG